MSRRRDPISEEGASYQKVLDGLKGLHQRLHDLSAARQQRPSVAPEILQKFDTAITDLEDELQTMGTGVLHSPFVDLATRTATHFCEERSARRFSERVLDDLLTEVGAGSGAVLLFRSAESEAEVMAARNDKHQSIEHDPRVSRTIIREIAAGNDSVLVDDAQVDELLATRRAPNNSSSAPFSPSRCAAKTIWRAASISRTRRRAAHSGRKTSTFCELSDDSRRSF